MSSTPAQLAAELHAIADTPDLQDPGLHNPATCTRRPCGRCAQRTPATPPPLNGHDVSTAPPPKPRFGGLTFDQIAEQARALADELTNDAAVHWAHMTDWEVAHPPPRVTSGDEANDNQPKVPVSEQAHRDQLEERRSAKWAAEYRTLLTSLVASMERARRLHQLAQVEDRTVHRTRTGELDPALAADAAAAGWCASCWRYEQTCHEREKDAEDHYYDRNHCRRCARFRNEHGILPPVELLRIWHGLGRRSWTVTEVDTALAKAKGRKSA